jgi:YHS domain-containing protein
MKILYAFIVFSIFCLPASAQDVGTLRKKHDNLENTIAIKGYDPVAYFTQNKAVKKKKEMAVSYQGIVYHFSSTENKALFKAAPFKYEPEYGGW